MGGAKLESEVVASQSGSKERIISYAEAGGRSDPRWKMRRDDSSIMYMGQGIGARGGNFQQSRADCGPRLPAENVYGIRRSLSVVRRDSGLEPRSPAVIPLSTSSSWTSFSKQSPKSSSRLQPFITSPTCRSGTGPVMCELRAVAFVVQARTTLYTFYSFFMHIPGLKVALPSTPYDVKGLLKTTLRDPNPVIFIEHKGLYGSKGHVPDEEYLIPFGQAVVRQRRKRCDARCHERADGHQGDAGRGGTRKAGHLSRGDRSPAPLRRLIKKPS